MEDEPAIAAVLQDLLEAEGYEVATAGDGHAALRRLAEVRPALVLSDVMMPRLDGWALCRALQADARYAAIPVVLMSAGAAPAGAAGCVYAAFVRKPFEVDTLLTTIRRVAGGAAGA